MGNCVKICTTTDLGDPTRNSGYIRAFDGKLYWSNGSNRLEISQQVMEKSLIFPDAGTDRTTFTAEYNFKINSIIFNYPTNYTISINGNPYTLGDIIYYTDIVSIFVEGGSNYVLLEIENVYINTLNLKPRINPNFDFIINAGTNLPFVVGVTNVSDVPTTAPFQFYIAKLAPIANIDTNTGISSVPGLDASYFTNNLDFTILEQATRWRFTSNTGVILEPKQTIWVGAVLIDTLAGSGNITVTVVSGTGGGETPTSDNIISEPIIIS